ncbi:hypothetical protein [Gordonia tangerina]|uniref:Uncharacterized protein n=1 Tax=Gordonia tangerina TaxID=2911060 RepID=A0ABS9DL34_9ACTN|nr:hypothetical protein [Gordonia tangerina]MCF3939953.1 hypothetical protein [Gordonia tangerina]
MKSQKPRVYRHVQGCWHIANVGAEEPCFWAWWDAYHDALYVHARKGEVDPCD